MQLFTVEITTEVVVVAESFADAVKQAKEISSLDTQDPSYVATEMATIPSDWDLEAIPFGRQDKDNPDKTIQQWIDDGAAPLYSRLRRKPESP